MVTFQSGCSFFARTRTNCDYCAGFWHKGVFVLTVVGCSERGEIKCFLNANYFQIFLVKFVILSSLLLCHQLSAGRFFTWWIYGDLIFLWFRIVNIDRWMEKHILLPRAQHPLTRLYCTNGSLPASWCIDWWRCRWTSECISAPSGLD